MVLMVVEILEMAIFKSVYPSFGAMCQAVASYVVGMKLAEEAPVTYAASKAFEKSRKIVAGFNPV